jgi:hypothetical protein
MIGKPGIRPAGNDTNMNKTFDSAAVSSFNESTCNIDMNALEALISALAFDAAEVNDCITLANPLQRQIVLGKVTGDKLTGFFFW